MIPGLFTLLGMVAGAKYLDASSPGKEDRRREFWRRQNEADAEYRRMRREAGLPITPTE